MCVCELNFDREKREKNPKFIHTFLTHLGLQCPLMAAQVHTRCVRVFKKCGGASESEPPTMQSKDTAWNEEEEQIACRQ